MSRSKRRPGTALILGAALLVIGAAAFGLREFALHRAEVSFRVHEAEVAAVERESPTRTGTRGPIERPDEPGSAWDLLIPAFEGFWSLADPPSRENGISLISEPNFTAHGAPGDTEVLLERSAPYL